MSAEARRRVDRLLDELETQRFECALGPLDMHPAWIELRELIVGAMANDSHFDMLEFIHRSRALRSTLSFDPDPPEAPL